jgi:hypothetical protein
MKRRRRRRWWANQGKNFFKEFGPESPAPVTTASMIPIESEAPTRPGVIRVRAEPLVPSNIMARPIDNEFSYKVETKGSGYQDQRAYSYIQEGGKWKLMAFWQAEGTGPVPMGIRMLGQFQDIFNSLFNIIAKAPIEHQRIEKNGSPTPPPAHHLPWALPREGEELQDE